MEQNEFDELKLLLCIDITEQLNIGIGEIRYIAAVENSAYTKPFEVNFSIKTCDVEMALKHGREELLRTFKKELQAKIKHRKEKIKISQELLLGEEELLKKLN